MAYELLNFDPSSKSFTTPSGRTYFITGLSIARLAIWMKYDIWFNFNLTHDNLYKQDDEVIKLINQGKGVEAGYILINRKQAYKNVDHNKIPAIEVCTLFCNEKDEDIRIWDEKTMESKKEDWMEANIDPLFFITLAKGFAGRLEEAYKPNFPNTSITQEEKKQE